MTETKWNGSNQQFINQEHFTVIWSTQDMCSDHWSSNFPGAASPPPCCLPCWVAAACFTPDLSTHQSRDHVLLLQGSAWGPLGISAVVVEVMIIMVIIINKSQALLSILHRSLPCRQPRRQAQPVCIGPSNTCCGLGCVSGGFSAATPHCDALQGINLAWSWKVLAAQFLGSASAHHLTVFTPQRGEESCSSLGKVFIYEVDNCELSGSVAAEELGWKWKLNVQTSKQ